MPFDLKRNDVLTEAQLDDAVHALQLEALRQGMIPIAGIMSERRGRNSSGHSSSDSSVSSPTGASDGPTQHRVVGFGWNHLREGIPGIHGETGAIMHMGRLVGGYGHLVATSSLSPCPFCQNTLACQLGVKEVRILDVTNYMPDFSGYAKVGLRPVVREHEGIIGTFGRWVNDKANATIWNRDIGEWDAAVPPLFDVSNHPARTQQLLAIARHKADEGSAAGEAPIGAVVVDGSGEIIGAGHGGVLTKGDPSLVPAMAAWRACGARDHWKDKTLLLTAGPDHIAYSMFHVFRFGQLVIGSTAAFKGQTDAVRKLGVPVHILDDGASAAPLQAWVDRQPVDVIREYLGADFVADAGQP